MNIITHITQITHMILLNKFIGKFKCIVAYANYKNIYLWPPRTAYVNKYTYEINYIGIQYEKLYLCTINRDDRHVISYVGTKIGLGLFREYGLLKVSNRKIAEILVSRGLYSKYINMIGMDYHYKNYQILHE